MFKMYSKGFLNKLSNRKFPFAFITKYLFQIRLVVYEKISDRHKKNNLPPPETIYLFTVEEVVRMAATLP